MNRKLFVSGLLVFAVVAAFLLGFIIHSLIVVDSSEEVEFSVPVEVYGFTEKIRVELYHENGGFFLCGIDSVDHMFTCDLSFREHDSVNVYVLTEIGIELWSGKVLVSENHCLVISNSTSGVNVDYLEVQS